MTRTPDRRFQAAARDVLLAEIEHSSTETIRVTSTVAEPGTRHLFRVGLAVLIAGATVTAAWIGIAAVQDHHQTSGPPAATDRPTDPSPSSSPTASSTRAVSDDEMRTLINQVSGSGTLTGPITGDFTITHEYGTPILHLTHLAVGSSTARTLITAVDLASATCKAQNIGTVAGTISANPTQKVTLVDSSPQTFSDLTYTKALAIWPGACEAGKVSAGAIHWSIPAKLRGLAQNDLGARPGARGVVKEQAGRPARYTVTANDVITSVAARFGLTPNELLYLNPFRDRGNSQQLYVGETLNLDPLDQSYFSRTGE